MASKIVLDAVKARQEAEWTALPVYYPNTQTKPPADLSAFVTVEAPVGDARPLTIDGADQETGAIRFVVHVALKSGTDTALTYADELAAVFRQVKLTSGSSIIRMGSPTSPVDLGDHGGYYLVSFSVPFIHFIS